MKKQSELLDQDWDWLIICDAGRADVFEQIYPRYFEGDYEIVYNGGHCYTRSWFNHHFPDEYNQCIFHGGAPLHSFPDKPQENYNEKEHFSQVIGWPEYDWDEWRQTCPPKSVIGVVKEKNTDHGIIRFLQPHTPYRQHPEIHSIQDARKYSDNKLLKAYYDNFRWVLEEINHNLLPNIRGRIIITSDHGDCLGDCGQYLHGRTHNNHDHLVNVPWLEL